MRELANRVTVDDVVVLHPAYAMPMYRYYRRVTPDPLPMPAVFTLLTRRDIVVVDLMSRLNVNISAVCLKDNLTTLLKVSRGRCW
jgi:hypothetical protein